MERCNGCEFWQRDPVPYNGIYFGKCALDGNIKYDFHECDVQQKEVTIPPIRRP
jgi:hypothetical protein